MFGFNGANLVHTPLICAAVDDHFGDLEKDEKPESKKHVGRYLTGGKGKSASLKDRATDGISRGKRAADRNPTRGNGSHSNFSLRLLLGGLARPDISVSGL